MQDRELVEAATESLRYPALMAYLSHSSGGKAILEPSGVLAALQDKAELMVPQTENDMRLLLEEGEIGAARFLQRCRSLGNDLQIIQAANRFDREIAEELQRARGLMVQVEATNPAIASGFRKQLGDLDTNQLLLQQRQGRALELLRELTRELTSQTAAERLSVTEKLKALETHAGGEPDVQRAVERARHFLNATEGLASAARMLAIGLRAQARSLNADDLHQLRGQVDEDPRVVRSWSEIRKAAPEIRSPADVIEWIASGAIDRVIRLPTDFERNRLREVMQALNIDRSGAINTKGVADVLRTFLNVSFDGEGQRETLGTHFPMRIPNPRITELSGKERRLLLSVPLRGTDASAIGKLLSTTSHQVQGGHRPLHVLIYPGVSDPERPLSTVVGLTDPELPYLDCLDLLRIAECPAVSRSLALQQVLLPRMISVGTRLYQTGGPVTKELFRGRTQVIEKLKRARGPTVLFSGRMMGKSSVLFRIHSQIKESSSAVTSPKSVLVSASTGMLLDPLLDELIRLLPLAGQADAVKRKSEHTVSAKDTPRQRDEKERQLLQLMRRVIEQVIASSPLTILIDEADMFAKLESSKNRAVSLAWTLRDIENHRADRLRVVFAGFQTLHHEVIAANGAFANWFGQLALGPFERDEATALITEPLADFGVRFASETGVERILDFTGRYPLLIQEVCDRLMRRVAARQRGALRAGDEISTIGTGEIETVCRDNALRSRLLQVLSLNLNQYPRLKLVIYLILRAEGYVRSDDMAREPGAFRLTDVQAMLIDWFGAKTSEYFSERSLPGLVEELVALGLLGDRGDGSYIFLNRTFASMLRDTDTQTFENELLDLLDRATHPSENEARRYWSLPTEHVDSLLRSQRSALLVGLPSTLKSYIAETLFSSEGGSSIVVNEGTLKGEDDVLNWLRRKTGDKRTTLTIPDLCVGQNIKVLVLDGPRLDYANLASLARSLEERGHRLVAIPDIDTLREHLLSPLHDFETIPLRRLRALDIRAWGEQPFSTRSGKASSSLILDERTSESVARLTCGYFPLLQLFRSHCEQVLQHATERYPDQATVDKFAGVLTQDAIQKALLHTLQESERAILRKVLELHGLGSAPFLECELVEEELLDDSADSVQLGAAINAIEFLSMLDLLIEEPRNGRRCFIADNFQLLARGLGMRTAITK